jgi:hypothetical protein
MSSTTETTTENTVETTVVGTYCIDSIHFLKNSISFDDKEISNNSLKNQVEKINWSGFTNSKKTKIITKEDLHTIASDFNTFYCLFEAYRTALSPENLQIYIQTNLNHYIAYNNMLRDQHANALILETEHNEYLFNQRLLLEEHNKDKSIIQLYIELNAIDKIPKDDLVKYLKYAVLYLDDRMDNYC